MNPSTLITSEKNRCVSVTDSKYYSAKEDSLDNELKCLTRISLFLYLQNSHTYTSTYNECFYGYPEVESLSI